MASQQTEAIATAEDTGRLLRLQEGTVIILQGDHSGCVKPPVDTKTKVLF